MTLYLTQQPAWIVFGKPIGELDAALKAKAPLSAKEGLPRALIVEFHNGKFVERVLVGDVNALLGYCDDCALDRSTIAIRYLDLSAAVSALEGLADAATEFGGFGSKETR